MRSGLRSTLLLVLLGLLATDAARAQSTIHAVVAGRVVDAEGKPMPGVTVTALSPTGGLAPSARVTDAKGQYRIVALPPRNDFRVIAEIAGFARVEVAPIDLNPGRTTTVNITLVPSSEATERITVVAKGDLIDLASTKTSTVFNSEFIEGLPIMGRTYQSILTLAPGVTDVDGDGNPNVNGARSTELQTLVDGANTTDPFTGTYGQSMNIEAIAEMEVVTTGFPAEFGGAQGGFNNIITKSGGNQVQGSIKLYFRTDLFDNDGANNNDVSDADLLAGVEGFSDVRPIFSIGGPIVKDRAWYFVALEYFSLETPVNAGSFAFLRTQTGWNNFGKLSWQVNPANRISLSLNVDPVSFTGLNLRTGVAPESDYLREENGRTVTARWSNSLSPTVLLETVASRFHTVNVLV